MNPEPFLILKTFLDDFITSVYHRSSSFVFHLDGDCLKTYSRHVALLNDNFYILIMDEKVLVLCEK